MKASEITVNISCRRKRKIRTWIYYKALEILNIVGAIDKDTAFTMLKNYSIKSVQFRIGNGKWMPLAQ